MLEGRATWAEIKTMTLDEVDLLNLALDAWNAAQPKPRGKSRS